ncbi:MAG: DUF4105 domain-containing protein [Dysgonomonas sp.]
MIKKIILAIFCIFSLLGAKAQQFSISLSDSVKISLLTSYPWQKEVYAVFGHTALRVHDLKYGQDIVFNYGLFDYSEDSFIYRFAKGETYYVVGAIPYHYYSIEYQERNVPLIEQELNLTKQEKEKIWNDLMINCLPENRTYLYNFLFDNCATRIRDIVEKNIDGKIVYTPTNKHQSFRDLLNEHTYKQPWLRFGINLVIGSDADREATDREKMFLPIYMMNEYNGAQIISSENIKKNFILSEHSVFKDAETGFNADKPMNYPLIWGFIFFLLLVFLTMYTIRTKKTILRKIFFSLVFFVSGLSGCVIFFLMFFSIHPATNPNWNLVWLNPLQLIFSFFFFFKFASKVNYYYHFINFVALSLFLLAWFLMPQQLEVAFIPYILTIGFCSFVTIWLYKSEINSRRKKQIQQNN